MKNPSFRLIFALFSVLFIITSCTEPIQLDGTLDLSGLGKAEKYSFAYRINNDPLTTVPAYYYTKARSDGDKLTISLRSDSSKIDIIINDFDGLGFYTQSLISMDYQSDSTAYTSLCGTADIAISEFSENEFVGGRFTGNVYFTDCSGPVDLLITKGTFYLNHKLQ